MPATTSASQGLGAYERIHTDGNNGTTGEATTRYGVIGVQVPLGPGTLSAQYGDRNKGATAAGTAVAKSSRRRPARYSVSYKYGFSKRTYVYTWAAQIKADSDAQVLDSRAPKGGRVTAVGFGIQHNF
jgi:predicted porin